MMLTRRNITPLRKLMMIGETVSAAVKLVEDTATGNPLTFITDVSKPLKSLLISFTPKQSGTPSLENILPITGWDAVNVYHGADQTDYDTYPASFPSTIYGGYVDMVTGEVWATWEKAVLNDTSLWKSGTGTVDFYYDIEFPRKLHDTSLAGLVCSCALPAVDNTKLYCRWRGASHGGFGFKNGTSMETPITLAEVQQMAQDGDISIAYDLASPVLITTLTPQQINAIKGNNTIWSDANGNCEVIFMNTR